MRREFLQFSDLYIKNEYQEQLSALNMVFLEGETHLLWGSDGTPRILANLFRGKGKILKGSIRMSGGKTESCSRECFEKNGIFFVDRQVEFMNSLNLAENLFLLKENSLKKIRLNRKVLAVPTRELLKHYELDLDAEQRAEDLRVIEKVWFQIARLADRRAKMLVLGELTQICSRQDLKKLLGLLKKLREEGISLLIYDSHPEYFMELADDHYVMRGGSLIKKFWDRESFVKYWYRNVNYQDTKRQEDIAGKQSTCSRFIWRNQEGKEAILEFRAGEIVYVRSSGWEQQQELLKNLLGENGRGAVFESVDQRFAYDDRRILAENRIGYWGEEPLKSEYLFNLSVRDNILLPSVKKISRAGFYQAGERFVFRDLQFCPELKELEKSEGLTDESVFKILCYRWKLFHPKVLILHNVLSRADIEMRQWLQTELLKMAGRGTALILLEAFEEDALPFSDRVVVPDKGWI